MSEVEWPAADSIRCRYDGKDGLILAAKSWAREYGLDPALVCALCQIESDWNPWAVRHEAGYEWLVGFVRPSAADFDYGITYMDAAGKRWRPHPRLASVMPYYSHELIQTELLHQQTSWSLMQEMGGTARDDGYTGPLTALCDPAVGLEWGCRHLKHLELFADSYGIRQLADPSCVPTRLVARADDLAAAWNAGHVHIVGKPAPDGMIAGAYQNQAYVDRVMAAMEGYK